MPIYEYQCGHCGHQLEILQRISEAPLTVCPECQEVKLAKLISNTSFQLKGTGWYKTDYASKPAASEKTENHAGKASTPSSETASNEQKNSTNDVKKSDKGSDAKAV